VSEHGETTRQAHEQAQQLIQAGLNRPQSITEQNENLVLSLILLDEVVKL